jgi:hypothetical protein
MDAKVGDLSWMRQCLFDATRRCLAQPDTGNGAHAGAPRPQNPPMWHFGNSARGVSIVASRISSARRFERKCPARYESAKVTS